MKWFKENPIVVKVLLFVGLAGIVYFAWKKGLFGSKNSVSMADAGGDPLDKDYANKLIAFIESKWGSGISGTALEYSAQPMYAAGANLGDYMINGQWTKPGSIMAAFGSGIHGWAANGQPAAQADWEAMYNIWREYKNKKLKQSL